MSGHCVWFKNRPLSQDGPIRAKPGTSVGNLGWTFWEGDVLFDLG